ncbi:hypothetical protein DY000_02037783 [Brassica cretica]|uniref:Uncharacterized protein n=1 Tax=Brassica cretica TaxID=69181 RepID=A0ABQ7BI05_BRACR|nr:hypothetical protein DY000_02037783 [Brassica cretica]
MNLGRELRRGRELFSSYRVSSRDGRLQSGSRDEAEMNACSRGREMRLRRKRAVGVALPRAIASLFLLADGCVWSGIWSELDAS